MDNIEEKQLITSLSDIYQKLFDNLFYIDLKNTTQDDVLILDFQQKNFIKMLNLVRACHNLYITGYFDEILILVRTMFENFLNLAYICENENKEEIIKKINLFYNYQEHCPYYKISGLDKNIEISELEFFKKEYPNKNSWNGLSITDLYKNVFKFIKDDEFKNDFFNIWKLACFFSHPTFTGFNQKTNSIHHIVNKVTVLYIYNYLFLGYLIYFKESFIIKDELLTKFNQLFDLIKKNYNEGLNND